MSINNWDVRRQHTHHAHDDFLVYIVAPNCMYLHDIVYIDFISHHHTSNLNRQGVKCKAFPYNLDHTKVDVRRHMVEMRLWTLHVAVLPLHRHCQREVERGKGESLGAWVYVFSYHAPCVTIAIYWNWKADLVITIRLRAPSTRFPSYEVPWIRAADPHRSP